MRLVWTAACITLALIPGCAAPGAETPGYPLYPNPQTRLPADQVARLVGTCSGGECLQPIKWVDGQDVAQYGGAFDLLPGCHIVTLSTNFVASSTYVTVTGSPAPMIFALRMKAGNRYVVQRDILQSAGMGWRIVTRAREEEARGGSSPIRPILRSDEIADCKAWEPSAGP